MYVGIQFEAPDGFGSFRKDTRYYFAGDRPDGTVLVVWFAPQDKKWRVYTMMPSRISLEAALTDATPKLKVLNHQFTLPPWLEEVDGVNFDELDQSRTKKKLTYRNQVEGRLMKIGLAVEVAKSILIAHDPLREIVAADRNAEKSCHAHRLQLWFFAYVLHGENEWALKQPTHRNGLWSRRTAEHGDTKFGRKSIGGAYFGSSSSGMRKDIVKYYLARCGTGITMRSIHRETLRKEYGCVVVPDETGNPNFIHPQNKPFPSCGQFRYVIVDELGLPYVQTKLYGAPRMRTKAAFNEGNFTGQYANILEAFEVDAYYTCERATAMYSDEPAEALAVAEGICATTGAVVGVGFSLGSETGEAYRSMLFCMAVDKTYIAKIYGIPSEHLHWLEQGLPANFISDRGPAGHRNLAGRLEQAFPIKSIAPSYSGQSKALVESTHPREVILDGAPSFVQSDLNVIQMMKRELYRASAKNHSKDISARLSDQAIRDFQNEGRVATPHHYWDYLNKRLRTSARSISLEEAVRAFWTPVEFAVDLDGVKHRHRHYMSDAFRSTGFMSRLGKNRDLKVKGYVLSLVVRYVWIEVDQKLVEVEACRRVRIGDEDRLVPLSEFEQTASELAALKSKSRLSAQAAVSRAESNFKEATGLGWNQGVRKQGSPKKASGTTAHEGRVAKGNITGKAAA